VSEGALLVMIVPGRDDRAFYKSFLIRAAQVAFFLCLNMFRFNNAYTYTYYVGWRVWVVV